MIKEVGRDVAQGEVELGRRVGFHSNAEFIHQWHSIKRRSPSMRGYKPRGIRWKVNEAEVGALLLRSNLAKIKDLLAMFGSAIVCI